MGKNWASGLLLMLVLLSSSGIATWSQGLPRAIYIVGIDEPDTSYSLMLVAGETEKIVVRDSRLAGLYVEAVGNTARPGSYSVEIVNSTISYLVVSPSSVAVRLVNTVINNSRIGVVSVSSWDLTVSGVRAHWMNLSVAKGAVVDSSADAIFIYVSGSIRIVKVEAGDIAIQDVDRNGSSVLVDGLSLACTGGHGSWHNVSFLGAGNASINLVNSRLSCDNQTVLASIEGFKEAVILNSSMGSITGYTMLKAGTSVSPSRIYIGKSTISGNLHVESERIHIEESRIGEYWHNGTIIRNIRGLQTVVYLAMFHDLILGKAQIAAYSLMAHGFNSLIINSIIIATYTDLSVKEGLNVEKTRLLIQSLNIGYHLYGLRIADSVIAGNVYVNSFSPIKRLLIQFVNDKFTQTSRHVTIYVVQSDYPIQVEFNNSIIDNPGFVFSIVSNPLSPSKEEIITSGVYWSSPLGPTIIRVNDVERRGGATISIISPNATISLVSWKATPLGPLVKPCEGNPGLMAGPGRYAFGTINGRCALILDTEKLVSRVWVYSRTPLRVEVAGLEGDMVNATVAGNTTIALHEALTTLFVYYYEAGVQTTPNPETNTTTTAATTPGVNPTNSPTSNSSGKSSSRRLAGLVVDLVLVAALATIGYYFYTVNKKS